MTTQLGPDRLGLPPPLDLDLVDAGRVAGWIANNAVGFRGLGDETEAAHAAWVAHRTLARRLARSHRIRPVPVDVEPLALQQVDGREMVLASGRPIAALIRPGPDSRGGADSFGFELSIPREQPAMLDARVPSSLTRVALAVLPLSVAAVLFAGVAQLITIPLTAALLAEMGAGSVMFLRSRRPR